MADTIVAERQTNPQETGGVVATQDASGTKEDVEKSGADNQGDSNWTQSEKNLTASIAQDEEQRQAPPLKGLSFLDRFLVLWIILAMAIGLLLGNFVPSTGEKLQQGTFVGVSIPIGMLHSDVVQGIH